MAGKPPPPPKPRKDAYLGIRIDPELKRAVEQAAAAEERPMSRWVAMALHRALGRPKP